MVDGSNMSIDFNSNPIVNPAAPLLSASNLEVNGSSDTIAITGSNQTIKLTRPGCKIQVPGSNDTIFADGCKVDFLSGNSNTRYGKSDSGSGWTAQMTAQSLGNSAPPPTTYSGSAPMANGAHNNSVYTYPVPTPEVTVCPDGVDPIIPNLNGGAVDTVGLSASPASFDMQNNGQTVRTGWGTAGEGYLIFDPNDTDNSTAITQDSQLVGGFGVLQSLARTFDGAASGTLTASDALWNDLKMWVDTTGTGQFQQGQLMSLDQLGIASINLNGAQVNQNSNGNENLTASTFTRTDGSTGNMAGVNLMYQPGGTSTVAASATTGAAPLFHDVPDSTDGTNQNAATDSSDTQNVLAAICQAPAVSAGTSSGGDIVAAQLQNLVAAMATFAADSSAGTTATTWAQNDPQLLLAANLY